MIHKAPGQTKPNVPHPSVYIREEMRARRWSRDRLAHEMGGEFGISRLCLDMYFSVGPKEPTLRIGSVMAFQFARAFGVEARFFLNLEKRWLASVKS